MASLSSDCVSYLRSHGRKLRDIADLLDVSESYISRVARGEREFTLRHLNRLELALGKPVPLMLLEAMRKDIDPDFLPAYEEALRLVRESTKLRTDSRNEVGEVAEHARLTRKAQPRPRRTIRGSSTTAARRH